MNYKIGVIGILLLLVIPLGFSSYENYIDFYDITKEDSLYYVSYDFDFRGNFSEEEYFEVELLYEDQPQGKICNKQINTAEESIFQKITCQFEHRGPGEYTLRHYIKNQNDTLYEFESSFYEQDEAYGYYDFKNRGENGTEVVVKIRGNISDAVVYSDIPSSVISNLNEENKDDLISSQREFTIIEENPLIAWNVESVPEDISYEVKKNISQKQQEEFSLKITQSSKFSIVKYLSGFGIFLILFIIFIPVIRKLRHKK